MTQAQTLFNLRQQLDYDLLSRKLKQFFLAHLDVLQDTMWDLTVSSNSPEDDYYYDVLLNNEADTAYIYYLDRTGHFQSCATLQDFYTPAKVQQIVQQLLRDLTNYQTIQSFFVRTQKKLLELLQEIQYQQQSQILVDLLHKTDPTWLATTLTQYFLDHLEQLQKIVFQLNYSISGYDAEVLYDNGDDFLNKDFSTVAEAVRCLLPGYNIDDPYAYNVGCRLQSCATLQDFYTKTKVQQIVQHILQDLNTVPGLQAALFANEEILPTTLINQFVTLITNLKK